jgi:hypothetical protein
MAWVIMLGVDRQLKPLQLWHNAAVCGYASLAAYCPANSNAAWQSAALV